MKIKGAQKQLVVVRTSDSPFFDEAYFVLRPREETKKRNHRDILAEANRILQDCAPAQTQRKAKRRRPFLYFLLGDLCGTAIAVLAFFLFF